jgi:hypothetical protein
VKAQCDDVETIQIRLKQLKMSRTKTNQIVELPAPGGWICPVMAFKNCQKSRKEGLVDYSRILHPGKVSHSRQFI